MKRGIVAPRNGFVRAIYPLCWLRPTWVRSDYLGAPLCPYHRLCSLREAVFPGAVQEMLTMYGIQTSVVPFR